MTIHTKSEDKRAVKIHINTGKYRRPLSSEYCKFEANSHYCSLVCYFRNYNSRPPTPKLCTSLTLAQKIVLQVIHFVIILKINCVRKDDAQWFIHSIPTYIQINTSVVNCLQFLKQRPCLEGFLILL